jgi:hypothetical protein
MEEERKLYKVLVEKPEGKRPLGRPRRRWEDEIRMDLREIGLGGCTRFWWKISKERDHLEDHGVGGKMGSEWILGRLAWGVWIGFDWLRTGTGGGLL